jgi:hypothetical protein
MRCCECNRELVTDEVFVTDGDDVMCRECAIDVSNIIFDKIVRIYEEQPKMYRLAFGTRGIDDFCYIVDEEKEK